MILENYHPLVQRFIVGSIAASIVFVAIYYSYTFPLSYIFPIIAIGTVGLALHEYYNLARLKGFAPQERTAFAFSTFYIAALYYSKVHPVEDLLPLVCYGSALIFFFMSYFFRGKDPIVNIALTLFGIIYVTIPFNFTMQINYFFVANDLEDGRWWLFFLLAITYMTNTCALFTGKTFGRTQLAPMISPKKTWEGALGGFAAALVISAIFGYIANHSDMKIPMKLGMTESLILGSILSILAQIGDLAESLLKRDGGVKDSSRIPGLGGMLDVIDSLVFTAPVLYLYLRYQTL